MGALLRFIIVGVAGASGLKAIEEHPIAGFLFFLISLAGVVSILSEFGIIQLDEWPKILAIILGILIVIIDAIVNIIISIIN